MSIRPTATLSNNVRVANFSSPHPFNFVDGSTLEPCSKEQVQEGTLIKRELDAPFPNLQGVTAVTPQFEVSDLVLSVLDALQADPEVDVVIVPFPVAECLRAVNLLEKYSKCATVSVADRNTKAAHIDRFCR